LRPEAFASFNVPPAPFLFASMQVAENPGKAYNPLFIYGGVGLGKTHLIQAIGNHLKHIQPDAKIKYLHAERYVSDVVKAYENKSFDAFKKKIIIH